MVGQVMQEKMTAFFEGYEGRVLFNEPLAPYTSLKIGGPAEAIVFPESVEEVSALVKRIGGAVPIFVLGAGSNLLVLEGGIAGVVIHLGKLNQGVLTSDTTFYAEAGLSFPRLSMYVEKQELSGLEFAAGIPGTVGGAIAMNAGIPTEEVAAILKEVTLIGPEGDITTLPREAIPFSYRSVGLTPGSIVLSAEFRLQKSALREIEKKRFDLLRRRRATQPLSYPNAGSIFKNPKNLSAGSLIEVVGLKGHQIGGAQISERHGNFIINLGTATATDVMALIQLARERVLLEKGVQLETEIKIVGRG
jgi:UDP-N-acetylmuramate dehydrogenase